MSGDLKLCSPLSDYLSCRARHIAAAEPGVEAARALSALTDAAVRDLAEQASGVMRGRWAVVALGGWGAGALLPCSDLDVLILSESPKPEVRLFAESLLYPLWDAGMEVGHQVRTPKEQTRAARSDLKSFTATLTCRPIAGDVAWAQSLLSGLVHDLTGRRRSRLKELRSRQRLGSAYLLDTDLKEGAGGRRDLDELVWTAAILDRTPLSTYDALVAHGILATRDAGHLADWAATLAAARWRLQAANLGDRMTSDSPLDDDELQAVQAAMVGVSRVLEDVRRAAQGHSVDRTPISTTQLFELLDSAEDAFPMLCHAAASGRLDHLLPGFSGLMSLRRPGLGHDLTVGAHCLRAASLVGSLGAEHGALGESWKASDRRLVQTAALLHDIGKRSPGAGHAERGAAECAPLAEALLGRADSAVPELVRLHLLLAETATRSNLDDEDTLLRCAAAIGDEQLLAPLHVLTAVDSMATGPGTWSTWRSALVSTLVSRLSVALSSNVDGAGMLEAAEKTQTAALKLLEGDPRSAAFEFVGKAPVRYLASHEADEVASHARLVCELANDPGRQALLAVGADPAHGTHRLTIVAFERPDLLSRLSGALTLSGLDILSLDAFSGPLDFAVHRFVVKSATARAVTAETYAQLERLIRSALLDRLGLETRIRQRRIHYPARSSGPTRITVDASGLELVLRVACPDRPGLLYDVAKTVEELGLDIPWAFAETVNGTANDLFRICGPDGGAPEEGLMGHVCARLRELV